MGCLYDGPTKLATTLIGLQIAPLFNKPVLAESFSSFWGRRWNLCMGHSLRVLIYDPIQEGTVTSMLCRQVLLLLQIQSHLLVSAALVIQKHVA